MGVGSFKALTFDGIVSTDYGVYITGEGVYNAPQRAAEVVAIPGRNGAFIQDLGRFDNIQVTYTAGVFGTDQANFAAKIDAFRNALASRYGYCRLEDEYHQDEYREAAFLGGLEVDPAGRSNAGEFSITFECKPQRFLKTGETAAAVASGGTLTNPTAFDALPLILAEGHGDITVNGSQVTLYDGPLGYYVARDSKTVERAGKTFIDSYEVTTLIAATGDPITVNPSKLTAYARLADDSTNIVCGTPTISGGLASAVSTSVEGTTISVNVDITSVVFTYGTPAINTTQIEVPVTCRSGGRNYSGSIRLTVQVRLGSLSNPDLVIFSLDTNQSVNLPSYGNNDSGYTTGSIVVMSTATILGHPTYIDCAIGEAYKTDGAAVVSLNGYIYLGANLPKLSPGANTVTYSSSITSLEIIPRWWTV